MNSSREIRHFNNGEIDLRDLLFSLWRGRWVVFWTSIIFVSCGIAYAIYQPNVYTASVLLAPASDESAPRVTGQLAGLASLAGVSIAGGSTSKTAIAKEVLQSRAFLRSFIQRHNLAIPLMAAKAWSMNQEKWVIDNEVYDIDKGVWITGEGGRTNVPTDWDLVNAFRKMLTLTENKENGMVTVSITSLSPTAAQEWVALLIKDLNDYMREQDVAEAEASIEYLQGKLLETNVAGMQQIFYQLIENQTRTVMLANVQREYVFKTLDPAVVPQEKSGPKRAFLILVVTTLGVFVGMLLVVASMLFVERVEVE